MKPLLACSSPEMPVQYSYHWIQDWCQENGWTDLFVERQSFWAFPPGAVIPEPIPGDVLVALKRVHGYSPIERNSFGLIVAIALLASAVSLWSHSPFPLVVAFCLASLVVAWLEAD
jgi:hypothetical protein